MFAVREYFKVSKVFIPRYSIKSHVVKGRTIGVSQGEVQRLVVGSVRARGLK